MLTTFKSIAENVKLKPQLVSIDNIVFKLHYRFTFLVLLAATILVSSQQYVGEHIRCIAGSGVPVAVIETFCFFTSTFTVPKHVNDSSGGGIAQHPGVGPVDLDRDQVVHHAYYQWVPFVLFLQAIMFYTPHFIWRHVEGGRIKALVEDFRFSPLALSDEDITIGNMKIPSMGRKNVKLKVVETAFLQRLHINRPWALCLVFCELLNAVNIALQIFITDKFLGGNFIDLGPSFLEPKSVDTLDVVFPKVTKCTFYKYGPSGTIQQHDALCVMALNVINEKIYTFLWFWMVFLSVATALGLLWRVLTFLLHSRCRRFNQIVFRAANPGHIDAWALLDVTGKCYFSDWLFLYYLAKNINGFVIRDLFESISHEMGAPHDSSSQAKIAPETSETKALIHFPDEEKEKDR